MILPPDIARPAISLNDGYFDLKGLEVYSSLKVRTLRKYIRESQLPCYRIDGKILVKRSEFDAWIRQYKNYKDRDDTKKLKAEIDDIVEKIK